MTPWIQDYLPGMEFPDSWPPSWFGSIEEYCPCCSQVDDPEFTEGESCD